MLRESDLSAADARGRSLPVRFRRVAGGLAIAVDTRRAKYPVTVDPLVQQAELTATDGYAYEGGGADVGSNGISCGGLGASVAIGEEPSPSELRVRR